MKYLIFILLLFSCSKPIECWQCDLMYQKTDELIESYIFCDKTWNDMISIADSLNTYQVTYTHCKKCE